MKYIVRSILFDSFSLYVITQIFSGVRITGGIQNILLCGLILSILMVIVKPLIGILTFPLTILTLGLYGLIGGIISNAIIFYILTRIMRQFTINPFLLPAFKGFGISMPQLYISGIFTFILCGAVYFVLRGILSWLK